MYAYVVENRRKNWYTGAKHIKNSHFWYVCLKEGAYEDRVTGKSKDRHC